jgi:NlpC/P60 family putative phage cell wall peptidase
MEEADMETNSARIISIARSWIGTPYVHQASLKGVGCDCLGLLRGIWRELRGEEPEDIPPYAPDWDLPGGETMREALARHLSAVPLNEIAPGDVVLFRMLPRAPAKHCAIVAEKNGARTLIHARQNKRVSEEPFSAFWRKKLACAFRL